MSDLPSYYESIQENKIEYNDIFNDNDPRSATPPPLYKHNASQTSLLGKYTDPRDNISNPILVSGPPHLVGAITFDEKSVPLSEKIKCYIRIVEVFSSIAKEDMYGVPIIHVKKEEHTGLRALFNKGYQLKSLEVTYNNTISPGVFLANDCLMTEKAVIHLAVTSIYNSKSNDTELSPFGFTFFWNHNDKNVKISKEQKGYDISHLTVVPDEQIQAALFIWFKHRQYFPCLSLATQIYREGVEIYVVFEKYYF